MELTQQPQNLLTQVSTISKQYQKIALLTGENFNLFKLLRVTSDEVGTHSIFIAELLNIKGSHGQGSKFLQLFCEQFGITDFNCERSKVQVEKFISEISTDKTEGGRIDILITDEQNGNAIIIENKIYAGDQPAQLLRYNNFGLNKCKKYQLFYLTLEGKNPHPESIGTLIPQKDFIPISYKEDILNWLEKCKEKSVNHPILRETIGQYIHLIKSLTGQTINMEMKNEIVELLTSTGSNISAAIQLSQNVYWAKKKLMNEFAGKIESRLIEMSDPVTVEVKGDFGLELKHMIITLPEIQNEYLLFSFLHDFKDAYIEIGTKTESGIKNKKKEVLDFYTSSLEKVASNWGKIENTYKAWNGYWVCRFSKLDNQLNNPLFWENLVNNNQDLVEDICNDLIAIIEVMKLKHEKFDLQ